MNKQGCTLCLIRQCQATYHLLLARKVPGHSARHIIRVHKAAALNLLCSLISMSGGGRRGRVKEKRNRRGGVQNKKAAEFLIQLRDTEALAKAVFDTLERLFSWIPLSDFVRMALVNTLFKVASSFFCASCKF